MTVKDLKEQLTDYLDDTKVRIGPHIVNQYGSYDYETLCV